jgi:hypothetical protein
LQNPPDVAVTGELGAGLKWSCFISVLTGAMESPRVKLRSKLFVGNATRFKGRNTDRECVRIK